MFARPLAASKWSHFEPDRLNAPFHGRRDGAQGSRRPSQDTGKPGPLGSHDAIAAAARKSRSARPRLQTPWRARSVRGAERSDGKSSLRVGFPRPHEAGCAPRSSPGGARRARNFVDPQHARSCRWARENPRIHFHYRPTSASWINQVEGSSAFLESNHCDRPIS